MGQTAAAEYTHAEKLLTKGTGIAVGTSIPSAGLISFDILCQGDDQLDIVASIGDSASAAGDMSVIVRPYRGAANATILPGLVAPTMRSLGPTLSGSAVAYEGQYDVSGYDKVRVDVINNNAAAQTVKDVSWKLS